MTKVITEYTIVIALAVLVIAIVINALSGIDCTGNFGEVMC